MNSDLRRVIETRLAGTTPVADPADFSLPGPHGDVPAIIRKMVSGRLRRAAVLIAITEIDAELHVFLTERTGHLRNHAGQISFPGGRVEDQDRDVLETALRETHEEIGVAPEFVRPLGFLGNYITVTGYSVTPVVGFVEPGYQLIPDPGEVEEVFTVPLEFLLNPVNQLQHYRRLKGLKIPVYEFRHGGKVIWGATAGMLVGFREFLQLKDK